MSGRTVKIFLVDGIPTGLITAEIMNWTGKFTVAPRSQLAELAKRSELKRAGVYFLVGANPKDISQEIVYIGESDNTWDRLQQHNKAAEKEFWQKTIIVTSKDANLTKAHGRYLESRLIQITNQANRVTVFNGTNPETPYLPESDIADMENFLEQIQIILPVLGFTFAIPLSVKKIGSMVGERQELSPIFSLTYSGASATAQEINGEFVVLEGSLARKAHVESLADSYIHMREKLVKDGNLANSPNNDFWIFTQNVPFQSPSTAANIVGGASLNGRQLWKVQGTSKTYGKWSEEQIEMAEKAAAGM
jgi:hypothetical protein